MPERIDPSTDTHINITNLKAATGVSSNSLSDHTDIGSDNVYQMSDCLIDAVGIYDSPNNAWNATLEGVTTGSVSDGSTFKVKFQIEQADLPNGGGSDGQGGGEEWAHAVFDSSYFDYLQNLIFQKVASVSTSSYAGVLDVVLEFEVNGYGDVAVRFQVDEALNQHCINYQTDLFYESSNDGDVDPMDATPYLDGVSWESSGAGEMQFTASHFDPDQQISDPYLDWQLGITVGAESFGTNAGVTWYWQHPDGADNDETGKVALYDGDPDAGGTTVHDPADFTFTVGSTGSVSYDQPDA